MISNCGCRQVEGLEEVERAFVQVHYALRAEPEHKVSKLIGALRFCCPSSPAASCQWCLQPSCEYFHCIFFVQTLLLVGCR